MYNTKITQGEKYEFQHNFILGKLWRNVRFPTIYLLGNDWKFQNFH